MSVLIDSHPIIADTRGSRFIRTAGLNHLIHKSFEFLLLGSCARYS